MVSDSLVLLVLGEAYDQRQSHRFEPLHLPERKLLPRDLAQHVAATPDGLDVVLAIRHTGEFLTQLANENVDDLDFWLVHAAIEMVEKHLLGDRHALAQRQEFQHPVLFAGKIDALPTDLDGLAIEVDDEIADLDDRLSMSLRAAHDGICAPLARACGTAWSCNRQHRSPGR